MTAKRKPDPVTTDQTIVDRWHHVVELAYHKNKPGKLFNELSSMMSLLLEKSMSASGDLCARLTARMLAEFVCMYIISESVKHDSPSRGLQKMKGQARGKR